MAQPKMMELQMEDQNSYVDELKPGQSLLNGQYTIVEHLNSGGFGITYLAKDSLDRDVVIKECFLPAICQRSTSRVVPRSAGKEQSMEKMVEVFVREAHSLAKLEHPNIVAVHQVFQDNGTAYMALDLIEGRDLLDLIEDPKAKLSPDQIVRLTKKMLSAIEYVHANTMLHRDISPDNIILKKDGTPVLIDFGATRDNTSEQSRALTAHLVVKDGYSPQEFYIKGAEQGTYSDLYSFGATLYHLISNEPAANGQVRLVERGEGRADSYQPLAGRFKGYPTGFLEAIDQALKTLPRERIQTVQDWFAFFEPRDTPKTATASQTLASPEPKNKMNYAVVGASGVVIAAVAAVIISQSASSPADNETTTNVPTQTAQVPVPATESPTSSTTALPDDVLSAITQGVDTAADDEQVTATTAEETTTSTAALPDNVLNAITQDAAAPLESLPDATDQAPVVNESSNPNGETAAVEAPEDVASEQVAEDGVNASATPPAPALPVAQVQVAIAVWDVQVPFNETYRIVDGKPAVIISRIDPSADLSIAGDWIAAGLRITAINDQPIQVGGTLAGAILDQLVIDPDGYSRTAVTFEDTAGQEQTRLLSSKVVRVVSLANGVNLIAENVDGQWATTVRSISPETSTSLQVGDQIFRDRTTGIAVNGPETFEGVVTQLAAENLGTAVVTVLRDSQILTATMPLALTPDSQ